MATDSTDWAAKWAQEEKDRKAAGKAFLLSLIPAMKAAEYRYLVGYFDGSGDSGTSGEVLLSNEDAALDARFDGDISGDSELPESIDREKLENAIWGITPPGFEINEGGFGAVILDAETGKVRMNYSYRVEDSCEQDEPEV